MKINFLSCIFLIFVNNSEPLHLKGKLSGGNEIATNKHIFFELMAALFYENIQFCSAVLVSQKHLLTAACCIATIISTENTTLFDHYYALIASQEDEQALHPHKFQQVEVHPFYDLENFKPDYNFGIITLSRNHGHEIQCNYTEWQKKHVRYEYNYVGYIPGYEIVNSSENDSFSQHLYLKYAKVTVSGLSHDLSDPLRYQWGDSPNFFVGIPKDEARVQKTDVGTPMFSSKPFKIRGILSYVSDNPMLPGLFIQIYSNVNWIIDAMADRQHKNYYRKLLMRPQCDSEANMPVIPINSLIFG